MEENIAKSFPLMLLLLLLKYFKILSKLLKINKPTPKNSSKILTIICNLIILSTAISVDPCLYTLASSANYFLVLTAIDTKRNAAANPRENEEHKAPNPSYSTRNIPSYAASFPSTNRT
jgi:hypothetical protein